MKFILILFLSIIALSTSFNFFAAEQNEPFFGATIRYKLSNIGDNSTAFEINPDYLKSNIPTNETFYLEVTDTVIRISNWVDVNQKLLIKLDSIITSNGEFSRSFGECVDLIYKNNTDAKNIFICFNGEQSREFFVKTIEDLKPNKESENIIFNFKEIDNNKVFQVTSSATFTTSTKVSPSDNNMGGTSQGITSIPNTFNKECELKECTVNVLKSEVDNFLTAPKPDGEYIPAKITMNLVDIKVEVPSNAVIFNSKMSDVNVVEDSTNSKCFIIKDSQNRAIKICEMVNNADTCSSSEWVRQIGIFKNNCQQKSVGTTSMIPPTGTAPESSTQAINNNNNNNIPVQSNQASSAVSNLSVQDNTQPYAQNQLPNGTLNNVIMTPQNSQQLNGTSNSGLIQPNMQQQSSNNIQPTGQIDQQQSQMLNSQGTNPTMPSTQPQATQFTPQLQNSQLITTQIQNFPPVNQGLNQQPLNQAVNSSITNNVNPDNTFSNTNPIMTSAVSGTEISNPQQIQNPVQIQQANSLLNNFIPGQNNQEQPSIIPSPSPSPVQTENLTQNNNQQTSTSSQVPQNTQIEDRLKAIDAKLDKLSNDIDVIFKAINIPKNLK
jgi:hypothetical protein